MAQLTHPNVVAIHDVDTERGRPFIAMELVEGTTLRDWMRARARTWPEIVEVFVAAGRGLAAAHRAGIVHRDFKPGNVLLSLDPLRVQVTDFGLARGGGAGQHPAQPGQSGQATRGEPADEIDALDDGDAATVEGTVVGTPAYMAPEQHAGKVVDARSDQYAFCVTLWEAAYGRRPFSGRKLVELAKRKRALSFADPEPGRRLPASVRAHSRARSVARSRRALRVDGGPARGARPRSRTGAALGDRSYGGGRHESPRVPGRGTCRRSLGSRSARPPAMRSTRCGARRCPSRWRSGWRPSMRCVGPRRSIAWRRRSMHFPSSGERSEPRPA